MEGCLLLWCILFFNVEHFAQNSGQKFWTFYYNNLHNYAPFGLGIFLLYYMSKFEKVFPLLQNFSLPAQTLTLWKF